MRTLPLWLLAGGLCCLAPHAVAQTIPTRMLVVRSCTKADSVVGRVWRSQGQRVWATFWPEPPRSELIAVTRTASWQIGSSRVAGTRAVATVPGPPGPADSAKVILTIRIVDTIPRPGDSLATLLYLDKRDTLALGAPTVLPEGGVRIKGVPEHLMFDLPWLVFERMVRAGRIDGHIGPHRFFLYDWEIHDLNTLYHGIVCGVGLGSD